MAKAITAPMKNQIFTWCGTINAVPMRTGSKLNDHPQAAASALQCYKVEKYIHFLVNWPGNSFISKWASSSNHWRILQANSDTLLRATPRQIVEDGPHDEGWKELSQQIRGESLSVNRESVSDCTTKKNSTITRTF